MRTVAVAHLPLHEGVYAGEDFLCALGLGEDLPFVKKHELRFVKKVDVVILGPNSARQRLYDTSSLGLLFGEDYSWEKSARAERLRRFMGDHPHGRVLLIPTSGGFYRRSIQAKLIHDFPSVSWLMPIVQDYHGNPIARRLIDDLRAAGIIASQ